MTVFAVVALGEQVCKLVHLTGAWKKWCAVACLGHLPVRSRLDRKIDMDIGLVHEGNNRVDLAPVIYSWGCLDAYFVLFLLPPMVLIAHPAHTELIV